MGREAVGPMCCVAHVKEPSAGTYRKEKGFSLVFLAVAAVCAVAPSKPLHGVDFTKS